eukprot:12400932-Karenia_brevis.AAC.1
MQGSYQKEHCRINMTAELSMQRGPCTNNLQMSRHLSKYVSAYEQALKQLRCYGSLSKTVMDLSQPSTMIWTRTNPSSECRVPQPSRLRSPELSAGTALMPLSPSLKRTESMRMRRESWSYGINIRITDGVGHCNADQTRMRLQLPAQAMRTLREGDIG